MQREVTDGEGTKWACAQAYAGLAPETDGEAAERAEGEDGHVEVVCTPSGGTQTIRLQLRSGWEESYTDEELLGEIEARKSDAPDTPDAGRG